MDQNIDRLGRSYKMITEEWPYLTYIRTAFFVIDMPAFNTYFSQFFNEWFYKQSCFANSIFCCPK